MSCEQGRCEQGRFGCGCSGWRHVCVGGWLLRRRRRWPRVAGRHRVHAHEHRRSHQLRPVAGRGDAARWQRSAIAGGAVPAARFAGCRQRLRPRSRPRWGFERRHGSGRAAPRGRILPPAARRRSLAAGGRRRSEAARVRAPRRGDRRRRQPRRLRQRLLRLRPHRRRGPRSPLRRRGAGRGAGGHRLRRHVHPQQRPRRAVGAWPESQRRRHHVAGR